MSFLSRLHKIVNATGGALSSLSPLSLSVDLAKAAFNDEDNDGLAKSLFKTGLARKDQFISGYTGAIGGIIGAVPEPVRAVPRFFVREGIQEPIANVSEDLETVWRNVISRPVSTALTASSLADAPGGGGIAGLFDTDNWRTAYKLSQSRSPGQALALGAMTKDITSDAEVASKIGSTAFTLASGTADAILRFTIDPTVIAGKSLKAVRLATITKPLDSAERVVALLNDPEKLPKFNAAITQLKTENPKSASAVIRDRLFHDHADGAEISAVLDKAKGQEQYLALRAFAGDIKAQQQLISMRSGIAEEVASLTRQAEDLAPIRATNPDAYTVQKEAITTQIDHWDGIDSRLDRATKAFNTLREEPRFRAFSKVPAIGEVRTAITRSDWYQESALAPTLHRIFDIKAQSMITAASPDGDIQLNRLMTSANLPTPRREELRTLFINAADKNVRRNTAIAIENESMNHLLTEAGMTRDELTEALSRVSNGRDGSMAALAKRERQAAGHSTSYFEGEDGVMQALDHPTWVTDDDILIPLVDMDRVKMAVSRIGEFRARHPSSNIPGELMEGFYRLWKPAVLIRPAWTVRVVGDEQLRILAQVGAMTHMENLLTGARDYTTDYIAAVKATRARPNASARVSFGVRDSEYRGYPIESAFGISDDMVKHQKELISSENQFAHAVGDKALLYQRDLRRTAAETFKTIYPDDKLYAEAYDYSVKRIRSNPIGKQILSGKSEDEVVTWLSSTPEGATVLRSNSVKAHNARNWVKAVTEEINRYSNGSDELFSLMASGKATAADLARITPDVSMRPFVHGEVLAQALGEGHISQTISRVTERAFKMFGKTPTDVMSRNRFFDEVYQAEVKRQIDITIDQGGKLNEASLSSISARARSYADQQVKFHLYDLAESSQLGEMAKFLSPFYNAWREVLTRWVGLAIQNPPFIARMNMAWSAPDKAGLVTDEDGNQVLWRQEYSDAKGDPNYRGKDRYITLPLPEWLHSIPGLSGLAHKGSVAFNKKSFSMLMALPGFGPPAQLLVNEIVKDRPDLADSVKFILPIGPSQNRRDLFIPAGMKRAISLGTEDQNYLNDKIRILMDKVTDISLGKRDFDLSDPDAGKKLYKEATDEANAYYGLRVVSALTLPAAATYRSPYAMYMEALNQARTRYYSDPSHMALADDEGNSRTPDEWFLDSFGKEYFALTQAVTKTMDGIPASLTAWAARKENRDLVERYAELGLGGLIIGEDSGEFNAQVAAIQKESALRPGSDKKQRESISFEDAYEDPQRRLGWIEYRRFMDKLEAIRISRGLPNLQVAGASDLASMRSFYTDALKAKNPAWADDFNQADKGKWDKKIDALRDISSRPEMQGREDMKGIREYLASRDKMTTILASRKKAGGAATLTASSNADLASTWDVITGALVRKNLAFQETFYRHLENDPLGL